MTDRVMFSPRVKGLTPPICLALRSGRDQFVRVSSKQAGDEIRHDGRLFMRVSGRTRGGWPVYVEVAR